MGSNLPGILSFGETFSTSSIKIVCKKQTDLSSQGKCQRHATTIDILVDDILLQIFDFFRKMHFNRPQWNPHPVWNWLALVHVCRRWRKIIFDSPLRLDLRILCTYGTPVRQHLGIWPAFPIDLRLSLPKDLKPKDEDSAIAALEHRDRVNTVELSATGSQIGRMAAVMQGPFPVLTHLYMLSHPENTPVLATEFLGGSAPRLKEISLDCIPFPALPTLLLSTSDLVLLKLSNIPISGYISPERMVGCLASLPRLKVLAIGYQDAASRPRRVHPPPVTRSVLPSLTEFAFDGAFEYLEALIAQIDSPQLEWISTDYLERPDDFHITQVSHFIDRLIGPELSPSRHARVRFHYSRVEIILYGEYSPARRLGYVRHPGVSFGWYDWVLTDLAQVLSQYSVALNAVHLELEAEENCPSDDAYNTEWLQILRQFSAMRTLYVSLELGATIYFALEGTTAEMVAEILPSLGLICLEGVPASSLEKILSIRRFSDHRITVVDTTEEFYERFESYVST